MKSLVSKLAVLPLAIASGMVMASTNLVENGSFENNTVTARDGKWQLFSEIDNWTRTDNAQFELQTNKLGIIDAKDGYQYLELDSTANYTILQSVPTVVGKKYKLSFDYSARIEGNGTTNIANIMWEGNYLASVNSATKGWSNYSIAVEASNANSVLSFAGAGDSDSLGAFIDNVSLTELVEPCAVTTGLYGINKFGSETEGYVYHFNPVSGTTTIVSGVTNTASNIASNAGTLYFVEQLDNVTRDSKIFTLDLATNMQSELASTTSYPIYRSAVSADGTKLRATSKTYMYDFNLEAGPSAGEKTVLGQLTYPGDSLADGDIAYSADFNVLYVLTGKALYTVDEGTLALTLVGEHGLNWASGIAISDSGTIYVSARESGENAKIYTLDPSTAAASFVMDGPAHINDLTYVSETACPVE